MPEPLHNLMSYLRVAVGICKNDPRDDAELLARFAETRDETAFTTLVSRHGKLVWRTCKAILHDTPDAEDVFQTVFLTLARKADKLSIKSPAGWLHQVARRAALNVRAAGQRRENLKHKLRDEPPKSVENVDRTEQYALIDEELARLPEKLRIPMVLHFLEEKTQAEVARILGCSRKATQNRLAKGEAILRERLERRGLTLGGVSVAALLGNTGSAPAVPVHLIENTAKAAVAFRAGALTGGSLERVQNLLQTLTRGRVVRAVWWVTLASIGVLGVGGGGLLAWKMFGESLDVIMSAAPNPVLPKMNTKLCNEGIDLYCDPLPKGAKARIGTSRFRGPGSDNFLKNKETQSRTALSPDGKMLATCFEGGSIYFWDIITGKQLHKIVFGKINGYEISSIVFSPDGRWLAYSTEQTFGIILLDAALKRPLLDPATGKPLLNSTVDMPAVDLLLGSQPVFTPNSKTVACVTSDGGVGRENASVTLYNVDTKKPLRTLKVRGIEKNSYLTSIVFSRHARTLACIEEKGNVHLLDMETGKEKAVLKCGSVSELAFTLDDNVVIADKDKIVCVWSGKTGKEIRQIASMPDVPTVVSPLSDGNTVLIACPGQISFRDVISGKESRPNLTCTGLINPVLLSPDGTKLIERVGNAATLWDVSTGQQTGPGAGAPRSLMEHLAFSLDSAMLATVAEHRIDESKDGNSLGQNQEPGMAAFQLWETTSGKSLGSLPVPSATFLTSYYLVAWTSRDTFLAQVGYRDSHIGLLHPGTFKWTKGAARKNVYQAEALHPGSVYLDDKVYVNELGKNIQIRELTDGRTLATFPASGKLAFSADHQILATQPCEREYAQPVTLWEAATGRKLYSVMMPESAHSPDKKDGSLSSEQLVMLSPDGRLIVTQNISNNGDNSGTHAICLWEHVSGRVRMHLSMPPECRDANVAFSPDNRLLAVAYGSGQNPERSIHIWNLATGKECQHFQGHLTCERHAPKLMFSPDGRCLASVGMDYTVLVWNVRPPSVDEEVRKPLSHQELPILKAALIGIDAEAAYRAMCRLRQAPEEAVSFVAECLKPQVISSETKQVIQEVKSLISKLDSDDFQTRTRAAKELGGKLSAETGEPVIESLLQQALAEKPSVEVKVTIANLLNQMKEERKWGGSHSFELVRMLRGIEVLERINNDPARKFLAKLVETSPRMEVRRDAQAALKRLNDLQSLTQPAQSSAP